MKCIRRPKALSGWKWKTTRCSQYSVSVQKRYPPAIQARATTPAPAKPSTASSPMAGPKRNSGTSGWTRVKKSRKSDSNIRGEALRTSERRMIQGYPARLPK